MEDANGPKLTAADIAAGLWLLGSWMLSGAERTGPAPAEEAEEHGRAVRPEGGKP